MVSPVLPIVRVSRTGLMVPKKMIPEKANPRVDPVEREVREEKTILSRTTVRRRTSTLIKLSRCSFLNPSSEEERRNAEIQIESFRALSGCAESVTTTLLISRGVKNIRTFDLRNEIDYKLFCLLKSIVEKIILYHSTHGHDGIIAHLKRISALCRTYWQKAVNEEDVEKGIFCDILMFLSLTKPLQPNGYTRVSIKGKRTYVPNYGLCTFGFMGKSLPYASTSKTIDDQQKVYESFKEQSKPLTKDMEHKIQTWAEGYFKDLKISGSGKFSSSGTFENNRTSGGFTKMVSDYYRMAKYTENSDMKNVNFFMQNNPEPILLENGSFNVVKFKTQQFATAVAMDVLEEFLLHTKDCNPSTCMEFDKHLPMIPIAIKELGGKSRIPCFSSGLLGTLTEPVRNSIFKILRKDPRCKFRLEGGKFNLIKPFLDQFEKMEIVHSSDLQISTDGFSFNFSKVLITKLFEMGKMNQNEYNSTLCSLLGFRMIEPSKKQIMEKNHLHNLDPDALRIRMSLEAGLNRYETRFGFDPNKYLKKWSLRGVIPELVIPDPIDPTKLVTGKDRDRRWGIAPPKVSVLNEYFKYHKSVLKYQFEDQYITRRGVQMGTSMSIAILYCYNVFCDDMAKLTPLAKGISQICGDDAIRAGNKQFIDAYRSTIVELGSVFSPLKDVIGSYPRGVFTEILFAGKNIVQIPKVKVIVRPEIPGNYAPEWIRAIHSINNVLGFRLDLKLSMIEEISNKFEYYIKNLNKFLPLGLPSKLGGLGEEASPMSDRNKYIWDLIKRVPDKLESLDLLRIFVNAFAIENYSMKSRPKISHRLLLGLKRPPTLALTKEQIEAGYRDGSVQWLYKELRRLRAGIEACIVLTDPSTESYTRRKLSLESIIVQNWRDQEKILRRVRKLQLVEEAVTDEDFILNTYEAIISTSWVDSILGTV